MLLFLNLFLTLYAVQYLFETACDHLAGQYIWMIPVYLFSYYTYGLLTRRMVSTNELIIILKANFFALAAVFFIVTIAKISDETSRAILLTYFLINGLNVLWSHVIRKYAFHHFKMLRRPIFAVCDEVGLQNIKSWFGKGNLFGYDLRYALLVDHEDDASLHHKIDRLIHNDKYDSAVIDIQHSEHFNEANLLDHIQKSLRRVIILPKTSNLSLINAELMSSVHHKGMAFYIQNALLSPADRIFKQGFDVLVALFLMIVTSPVLLWLYGMVFISTKGHPLFTHKRLGKGGKLFNVYKFRTMHLDADERLEELLENCEQSRQEWEADFKLKNDPRITNIGRFLRKTSLDELPQLINIFKGEMSLVGPRPIVEKEIAKYGAYFEYFTAVKPGITGLWQVSGRNDVEYEQRVQLDVWYVKNWSIELDVQILMKTVLVVLGRKGSY